MPRKGSPYGPAHERRRAVLLTPGSRCHLCGAPATELDHVPALSEHVHVEGSGCCTGRPACSPCQRRQGGELGQKARRAAVDDAGEVIEPDDTPGPGDPLWAVPWLTDLLEVPAHATWPRYMSAPHPDAVGSYGLEAEWWLEATGGRPLRYWQRLALRRQLEHNEAGDLVWLIAAISAARQSGKSIVVGDGALWRIHQAERWGEPQLVMHTGKDLPVCREVQRPARAWAKARGYKVREQNGTEEIAEPVSGSRWLVRARGSVYGYGVSCGIVDEAWAVEPIVVEDGLEPTMAERVSPQLVLTSTAHSRATALFPGHRAAALAELDEPSTTLLVEWSAHREADIGDRAAWRAASPHWSAGRERLLEARLARVNAGELLDPDEADPVESFRSQFLNVWPAVVSNDPGSVLIDPTDLAATQLEVDAGQAPVVVAVEDYYGRGAAVAAVAVLPAGRYELDGWLCSSWAEALGDVQLLREVRDRVTVIVGPALAAEVEPRHAATVATASDTRRGLAALRQLVAARRVVHEQRTDLEQLTKVRVREAASGLQLVAGTRADLTRAAAWALLEASKPPTLPSIG